MLDRQTLYSLVEVLVKLRAWLQDPWSVTEVRLTVAIDQSIAACQRLLRADLPGDHGLVPPVPPPVPPETVPPPA